MSALELPAGRADNIIVRNDRRNTVAGRRGGRLEKRRFTRVAFRTKVVISWKDRVIEGETADVSLKGMFLPFDTGVPLNEEVEVEIAVPDTAEPKSMRTRAVAVRRSEEGTGFEFGKMDFDCFFGLQEIITRISQAPGQIMMEVMKFVNDG
jgi:hypothetical protein